MPSPSLPSTPVSASGPDASPRGYDRPGAFFYALGIFALFIFGYEYLVSSFMPETLSFEFAGRRVDLHELPRKLLGSFLLTGLALLAAFAADAALAGWRESSVRHLTRFSTSARSDLVMWLLDKFRFTRWILYAFTFGIGLISGEWLRHWVGRHTGVEFTIGAWPLWAQLPVLYLVYTYLDYWAHRVGHGRIFWPIHRFHHAATDFCIVTATRVHSADLAGVFIIGVPTAFMGPSGDALLALFVWITFLRAIIHSRIPSNWGWVGRWLVQSPLDHRMHHILDMSDGPGLNYSLLPLWDRLHGTWRPGGTPTLAIGVTDREYRHGLWVMPDLVRDYVDFLKNVGESVGLRRRHPAPTARTHDAR